MVTCFKIEEQIYPDIDMFRDTRNLSSHTVKMVRTPSYIHIYLSAHQATPTPTLKVKIIQ
jgi:hypothetical protein